MKLSAGNAEYFITSVFFQMSENNISPILTSFKDMKVNQRGSDADVVGASCRCGAVIPDVCKYSLIGMLEFHYSLWNPARRQFLAETRAHEPERLH